MTQNEIFIVVYDNVDMEEVRRVSAANRIAAAIAAQFEKLRAEKEALRRRCEELEGMVKVKEWISVKDRLPQEQEEVLFLLKSVRKPSGQLAAPSVHSGFYFKEGLFKSWIDIRDNWTATHWQPMPNPPIK